MGKKKEYSKLILTTEDGKLQSLENGNVTTLFEKGETGGMMGLIIDKDGYYVNTPSNIYHLDRNFTVVGQTKFPGAGYHHMNKYGDAIYVAATNLNEIHMYTGSWSLRRIFVDPPNPDKPVKYKENYNHVNCVVKYRNKFYVGLNWFDRQYGMSGVAVFDKNWFELYRYIKGWETHDLQFYNEYLITICATSGPDKPISHPKESGILTSYKEHFGWSVIFEHDPDEAFCKALTWDDNYFYLCGGVKALREDRSSGQGIIYVLDKKFELVEKLHPPVSNIKGCRVWD